MNDRLAKIDLDEALYFYKSPQAMVDYSLMQSFSLIKSAVEVFAYYGINDIYPVDIRDFFELIQIEQKKNGKVFVPSPKKADSVLECCLDNPVNRLSKKDGFYHIESWDSSGYGFEIQRKKQKESDRKD